MTADNNLTSSNIPAIVAGLPNLSILSELMENSYPAYAYGLSGNETLFAPTDDAFAQFYDQELLKNLVQPEWNAHTRVFLHYHTVRKQKLYLDDLAEGTVPSWTRSPLGTEYPLTIDVNPLRVNENATVLLDESSIEADDGVIHMIDGVLDPPFWVDLWTAAQQLPLLSTLVELIELAELQDIVQGPGPLTVLAPTNTAFEDSLAEEELAALRLPENQDQLQQLLLAHILPENAYTFTFLNRTTVQSYNNMTISVDLNVEEETLLLAGQSVIIPNQRARNGLAHLLSGVLQLQPPGLDDDTNDAATWAAETSAAAATTTNRGADNQVATAAVAVLGTLLLFWSTIF